MVDDPNKAQAHLQPPQPNSHLKNLDRLVGTWERQRAVVPSRSTRRLPQHLVMVHFIPRLWGWLCLVLLRQGVSEAAEHYYRASTPLLHTSSEGPARLLYCSLENSPSKLMLMLAAPSQASNSLVRNLLGVFILAAGFLGSVASLPKAVLVERCARFRQASSR